MAYNLFGTRPVKTPVQNPALQFQPPVVAPEPTEVVDDAATGSQQSQQAVVRKRQQYIPQVNPNDYASGMNALAQMYTSPKDEEKIRKASVANQRILAVGDALRHIGNIYNTVKGAPPQKLNTSALEEYDRYYKGKAMRDAANMRYMSYMQQKANQDRAMAKMERDYQFKLADDQRKEALNDARISRYNAQNSKDAANQAYWETRARLQEEGWPLEKAIKEARRAQIEAQTRLTNIKAAQGGFAPRKGGGSRGGGNQGKYWDYDEDGNIHYYPNKTMYEQGVEEHSKNQDQNEKYPTGKTDWRGNEEEKTRKRTIASKAATNAANAHKRQAAGSRNVSKSKTNSAKSKFSIHNNK